MDGWMDGWMDGQISWMGGCFRVVSTVFQHTWWKAAVKEMAPAEFRDQRIYSEKLEMFDLCRFLF